MIQHVEKKYTISIKTNEKKKRLFKPKRKTFPKKKKSNLFTHTLELIEKFRIIMEKISSR